jgi:AcrR family transcriptional regulator
MSPGRDADRARGEDRVKDQTEPNGRQRLLDAALDHLRTRSEADLRVVEIANAANVAVGLIRHHFGSRDGLITAAQQVRLEGAVRDDLAAASTMARTSTDTDDLLDGLRRLTQLLLDPQRSEIRLSRIAVLATAHGRPEVRENYADTIGALLDALTEIIRETQESGLARTDLDPRAVATFIQAYAIGMTLHDLDPRAVEPAAMVAVIREAVTSLIARPAGAAP